MHPSMQLLESRQPPSSALIQQFQGASWIYTEALNNNAPAVDKAFRATYTPPSGVSAVSTSILITADDYFTLYVNGQVVGDTRSQIGTGATVWANVQGYSVTLNINGAAPIVFGIIVSNNANSASGLLAAMQLTLSDGTTATISSGGGGWRSTSSIPQNFAAPSLDDSGWSTPVTLSKNGASTPWGPIAPPSSLSDVALSPSQGASAPSSTTTGNTPISTGNQGAGTTTSPTTIVGGTSNPNGASTAGTSPSNSASGTNLSNGVGVTTGGASNTISSVAGATGSTGSIRPNATQGGSSSPTSPGGASASLPAQSGSHTPVAAIAGGVVGGVVLILLLSLLWFFCFRRKAQQSSAQRAPEAVEVRDSSSLLPSTQPRPFTMVAANHNRTDSGSSTSPMPTPMHKDMSGFGYQGIPAPLSVGTSDDSRAEDLNATLAKLQELTAELNRGLADHANTPRVALTVSPPQEAAGQTSTDGAKSQHGNDTMPPPYIDERRRP
ncbi:hypothetical protein DXG01_015393 [Tephrocybe rancida]|nr:hypothetical protein DXG01_015393 [Tephrocybe rancida]